jgi:putative peptidoglycan binding protein
MAVRGERILQLGRRHIGEPYVLGSLAPKNNPKWKGPWDCAEFASWLVFQAAGVLYGCASDSGDPASADAYTGDWARDAETLGVKISVDQAMRTPGATVLRRPQPGAVGHIVISDGRGGTVEAHSAKAGVIASTVSGRRWDMGILIPEIEYTERDAGQERRDPKVVIYRLTEPRMTGPMVREIQRALKEKGFPAGPIDGDFGPSTHAAVVSFQASRGLVIDGEVGPRTARALGLKLPEADGGR